MEFEEPWRRVRTCLKMLAYYRMLTLRIHTIDKKKKLNGNLGKEQKKIKKYYPYQRKHIKVWHAILDSRPWSTRWGISLNRDLLSPIRSLSDAILGKSQRTCRVTLMSITHPKWALDTTLMHWSPGSLFNLIIWKFPYRPILVLFSISMALRHDIASESRLRTGTANNTYGEHNQKSGRWTSRGPVLVRHCLLFPPIYVVLQVETHLSDKSKHGMNYFSWPRRSKHISWHLHVNPI